MEPFKNFLGYSAAQKIGKALKTNKCFDEKIYLSGLEKKLEPLSLKERMHLIKEHLYQSLPVDPKKSISVLIQAVEFNGNQDSLNGFLVWPLTEFVAEYGIDHFELSMHALYLMTQVFTAEFAIRPFLLRYPDQTLAVLSRWSLDPSEHVRRLVSEGTRPMLPWGKRLDQFLKNPEKTFYLLDQLKNDPSRYVQKSVANHLNDHSKNHPEWVISKLKAWKVQSPETDWIIRHASRTLVKNKNKDALVLHGVSVKTMRVQKIKIVNPKIRIGESIKLECWIENPTAKKVEVLVDHEFWFLKSNGELSPKVFKGKRFSLAANEKQKCLFEVKIRQVTTRKYYPGKQSWSLVVNGHSCPKKDFDLQLK